MSKRIAFIGGGHMASAIIKGLIKQGFSPKDIDVVEPLPEARDRLKHSFGITASELPGTALAQAELVVWAIKPQSFKQAVQQISPHAPNALHLSVAAGIRSDTLAQWLGSERVVRAMPNTPALIGKGITALFARAGATQQDKDWIGQVLASTGEYLWLDTEDPLDAVTALSGSGPAYVFYFMEAMITAGTEMGLTREQAHKLVVATVIGAGELTASSGESPKTLRQQVTSKGGTTHAAIASMEDDDIPALIINAVYAARDRAKALGDEFGGA